MNNSVYVFGNLGRGYTQYPEGYAQDIFYKFFEQASARSQIVIHRDKNLMYYGYVRKLDVPERYIGFCALLNGVRLSHIDKLFAIYEDAVADLVAHGEILCFNEYNQLSSFSGLLKNKQQEAERISALIREKIKELGQDAVMLPPVNYGIDKDTCKNFSYTEDKENLIIDASVQYGYTCIWKSGNCDAPLLTELREALRKRSLPTPKVETNNGGVGVTSNSNEEWEYYEASQGDSLPSPSVQSNTPVIAPPPIPPALGHQSMFSNPFSFSGRIRRLEYGLSFIIYEVWNVLCSLMASSINDTNGALILYYLLLFPGLWFFCAQGAKRCHDRGNSGWYQIIPFYGWVMLFGGGDYGTNEYGLDPKR